MASVYVTQTGAGTADGSSLENAIAIGSLSATEWNLPAKSADGAERIYFHGTITSIVQVLGAGGTDATDRLWVDCSNASINADAVAGISCNGKPNLVVIVGTLTVHTNNTVGGVAIQPADNIKITGGTITNPTSARQCIRATVEGIDVTNVEVDGVTCINTDLTNINCINYNVSTNASHTGHYVNPTIKNCTLTGGKILLLMSQPSHQIETNNRRPEGALIENNIIQDTPANAIQWTYSAATPLSYIRGNTMLRIGSQSTLTNAIQTNYDLGLIIENNHIDTVINGVGPTGDGNGIIVDWTGEIGRPYTNNVIVRNNYITGCNSTSFCAGISFWGSTDGTAYGNVCTGNTNGISFSDAVRTRTFTATGWTPGASTAVVHSDEDGIYTEAGDSIVISGVTINTGPDINGTHTILSDASSATLSVIDFDSTGGSYTGGSFTINRASGNAAYNNTCVNNTGAGILFKNGTRDNVTVSGNVTSDNAYGIRNTASNGSLLSAEDRCIFYNNSTDDVDDNGTPGTIDATSVLSALPPVDLTTYELRPVAGNIGIGTKWWTGVNPVGYNGEPFSDFDTDPGAIQSTHGPFHPVNL